MDDCVALPFGMNVWAKLYAHNIIPYIQYFNLQHKGQEAKRALCRFERRLDLGQLMS